jgi:ribosomal protein S18 acetylase RimI-like enzyme
MNVQNWTEVHTKSPAISRTRSHRDYMDVWRLATCNWSELCVAMGCTMIRVSGAIVHAYPIERSGTFYNFAVVQDPESFVIEDVENAYAERKLPFAIRIPGLEPYAELEKSLSARGYSLVPVWSLMTQNEVAVKSNPDVRVNEVDQSKLVDWFELQDVSPQVQSSRATRREMVERVSRERSAQLLMASLDGRPVGAGLLFLKDRIASIHLIATLTEFRRRHVATTITLEAIRRAKNEKADLVWLRTRKGGIGEKAYTKIGFNAFSDILSFTKTPEYEDSNLPPE